MLNLLQKFIRDLLPLCKSQIFLLGFISFLLIIFETLSIVLIIPVISLVVDFENTQLNINFVQNLIENYDLNYQTSIFFALIILIVIFIFKNIFISYYYFKSNYIIQLIRYKISEKLFQNYFYSKYQNFLQKNSALLLRNISNESEQSASFIEHLVNLISEILILSILFTLLLMIEFKATTIAFLIFLLSSIAYSKIFKETLSELGNKDVYHKGKSIQHILQIINNMKIIQLMGKQEKFLSKYNFHSKNLLNIKTKARFLSSLPRPIFEILIILSIAIVISFLVLRGADKEVIIFTLGVFGAVMFRTIPGISRSLTAYQNIKFLEPSVKVVIDELEKSPKNRLQEKENSKISTILKFNQINFKNIAFNYEQKKIFKNLNFEIKKNDVIGIIGESGTGKSTFVDILMGLLEPKDGELIVNHNKKLTKDKKWSNLFGYVPQNFYLMDDTIKNNICFGLEEKENFLESKLKEVIKICEIENFASLEETKTKNIGENGNKLSHGQRQRVAIARALFFDHEILILDEATSSLDIDTENKIINTLKNMIGKKTIIFISHRLNTLNICNKIFELKNFNLNQIK